MPKIIVKEYDNTKAGVGLYTNFSVLIPGLVRPRTLNPEDNLYHYGGLPVLNDTDEKALEAKATENARRICSDLGIDIDSEAGKKIKADELLKLGGIFDENGVYECSSQADFIKYVGRVTSDKSIVVKPGDWANHPEASDTYDPFKLFTVTAIPDDDQTEENEAKTRSEVFLNAKATWEETASADDKAKLRRCKLYYMWLEGYESRETAIENDELKFRLENEEDNYNRYVALNNIADLDNFETDPKVIYVEDENLGNDGEFLDHYGNQIAYELLGLGYTVLYKKFDNTDAGAKELNDFDEFWSPLKDKSIYDFRYILTGFMNEATEVNANIIKLAEFINKNAETGTGRGDCTALVEIPRKTYEAATQSAAVKKIKDWLNLATVSSYVAYFAPYVDYVLPNVQEDGDDEKYYKSSILPCAFHYLACAAKAAEYYNEWYAIAGYSRGISDLTVRGVGCRFGEEAVNALEPRFKAKSNGINCAANIITSIKGSYYLWGNRTGKKLGDEGYDDGDLVASHFLNIRQLCTTIKKQVYVTCRKYTYDPNSDILWAKFCADIRPLLEKMKADQGITDYKFIKVKAKQKAMLKAKIRIVPIEAVEDFDISLTLEDSVAGIVATVEEDAE